MLPKILYDTYVLGLAHTHPEVRTGVFRVVKNVIERLNQSNEVEVTFNINHNCKLDALEYIQQEASLGDRKNIYPSILQMYLSRSEREIALKQKKAKSNRHHSLMHRGVYGSIGKLLGYYSKLLNNFENRLDKQILSAIDIYHSPFHPIPEFILAQKKIKRFVTFYDMIPILLPHYFDNKAIIEDIKGATKSIKNQGYGFAISQSTKNDLCNYSKEVSPDNIIVTHLAASPKTFYPFIDNDYAKNIRLKYNIPDKPYFLSLCTLEPRKNIDSIIRSFVKLVNDQNLHELNLVLVGIKGWQFDKIFEEIKNSDRAKNQIVVTGFAEDIDLAPIYSGALGFFYMSLYEGFGLPPLEAMQCGVPVITSNTSSLPEVVGGAGIMLDPKDEDGLCQAMLDVYNSASLRAEMSRKSLAQAAKFSWDKTVQQTIQGYKTALQR